MLSGSKRAQIRLLLIVLRLLMDVSKDAIDQHKMILPIQLPIFHVIINPLAWIATCVFMLIFI